jgi:predicted GNAT family N-acyltransferase
MKHAESVRIVEVTGAEEMEQAWRIRRAVFIEEQGVPEEIEMDAEDAIAFHVIALDDEIPIGCGRMVPHDDAVKIGRMAVLKDRRGEGIGEEIIAFLMAEARERGYRKAILHAQLHAEGFYLKCGYQPIGEVFEEAGILHRRMEREL